jgi:hypothetical protein
MKRHLIPLFLAVAALPTGCSAAAPEIPRSVDEFFPLEDGRIHVFRVTSRDTSPTITIKDASKGHGYWSLDFWSGSSDRFMLALVLDSSGISIIVIGMGHGAMPIDPPLLLVPSTVAEGVPWSSSAKIGSKMQEAQAQLAKELARNPQMASLEFSARGSEMSTPTAVGDKSYQSRSVELRTSAKSPQGEQVERMIARLWIAPGVGIVKVELGQKSPSDPSPEQTWELREIKHKP